MANGSDGKVQIDARINGDNIDKDSQKIESALIAQMKQLVDKIDKLFSTLQPEVDVQAEADTSQAEADIKGLDDVADGVTPEIEVDGDVDPAKKEVDGFEKETEGIELEIPVDADTKKAKENVRDLDKEFDKLKDNVGTLAKAAAVALAAVGAALAAAAKEAIAVGMSFEAGMSEVKAISGATAEDMEALNDIAKEMGATTKFSASESAEALKYMGMAGWDAQQMVDGLPGVMNLAAASGESLGTVSDIVTDALTAMGLAASDSAHFADVLATAASSSNTNVGMMGQTFKYAAPLAGALGFNIEDLSVAIGLMANSGIKGEQAGTALRAILSRLAKPTKDSQAAMDKLGLSLTNADGTMRPLNEIIKDMRDGFDNLSEAEQANVAAMLGGQEAMSGLLAIVNASDEDFDNLTDAIANSSGAAEEMARIMNDNLKGDIVILGSALEGLGIQIFEAFNEPLREAAQAATEAVGQMAAALDTPEMQAALATLAEGLSSLIQNLAEFAADAIPKLVEGLAWVIENFDAITGALSTAAAGFIAFKTAAAIDVVIKKVTMSIAEAGGALKALSGLLMANPWAIAIAGAAALAAGIYYLATRERELSEDTQSLVDATNKLVEIADAHEEAIKLEAAALAIQKQAAADTSNEILTLLGSLVTLTGMTDKTEAAQKAQADTMTRLAELVPDLAGAYDEQTGALSRSLTEVQALAIAETARLQLIASENEMTAALEIQEAALRGQADAEAEAQLLIAQRTALIEKQSALIQGNGDVALKNQEKYKQYQAEIDALDISMDKLAGTHTYWKGEVEASAGAVSAASNEIEKHTATQEAAAAALEEVATRQAKAAQEVADAYSPIIQSTSDAIEAVRALSKAMADSESDFRENQEAVQDEAALIKLLAEEYTSAEKGSATYNAALSGLTERFGEFNAVLETQGGLVSMSAEEITEYGKALAATAEIELIDEHTVDLLKQQSAAERGLANSTGALREAKEAHAIASERIAEILALEGELTPELASELEALAKNVEVLAEQEGLLEDEITALSIAYATLAADSEASAQQRAEAQAVVDAAVANGMIVNEESLATFLETEAQKVKAAEETARAMEAAVNETVSSMQAAYEGYAAKAQDLDSKIGQDRAISLQKMQKNLAANTQVMNDWAAEMEILAEKMRRGIISEAFLEEIRSMGPEALKTVQKMNASSEEELTKTSNMYGEAGEAAKNAMGAELAATLGISEELAGQIATALVEAFNGSEEAKTSAETWIGNVLGAANTAAGDTAKTGEIAQTMDSSVATPLAAATETPEAAKTWIGNTATAATAAVPDAGFDGTGTAIDEAVATTVKDGTAATDAAKTLISNTKTAASNEVTAQDFPAVGQSIDEGAAQGIINSQGTVDSAARSMAAGAESSARSILNHSTGYSLGSDFGRGAADGISGMTGAVSSAASALASAASAAFAANLDINSPSRVAMELGGFFSLGIAEGIEDETTAVINAVNAMTDEMVDDIVAQVDFLAAVDYDELQDMAMSASMAGQASLAAIAASGNDANSYYSSVNESNETHLHFDFEGAVIRDELDLDYIAEYVSKVLEEKTARLNRQRGVSTLR